MPHPASNNDDFDDELLSAFVDDELTPTERAQVESRLKTDPRSAALVEELRALSKAMKSLPQEKLPRDLRSAVMANVSRRANDHEPVVLSMPTSSERWALRRRGMVWSAIAIAGAVLLSVTQPPANDEGDVARRSPASADGDNADNERQRKLFSSPADAERPVRVAQASPSLSAPASPAATVSQEGDVDSSDKSSVLGDSTLGVGFGGGTDGEADATKLDALASDGKAQRSLADGAGINTQPTATPASSSAESLSLSDTAEPGDQAFAEGGRNNSPAEISSAGSAPAVAKDDDLQKPKAAPRVVEITMARADAVSRFKQLLAENKIALSAANQTSALSPTKIAASAKATESGDILVEASPEQVDKLLFLCRSDKAFSHIASPGEDRLERFFADPAAMSNLSEALAKARADEATTRSGAAPAEDANRQLSATNGGKRKESAAKSPAADSYAYGTPAAAAPASQKSAAGEAAAADKVAEELSETKRRLVLFRFLPVAPPPVASPVVPAASPASK